MHGLYLIDTSHHTPHCLAPLSHSTYVSSSHTFHSHTSLFYTTISLYSPHNSSHPYNKPHYIPFLITLYHSTLLHYTIIHQCTIILLINKHIMNSATLIIISSIYSSPYTSHSLPYYTSPHCSVNFFFMYVLSSSPCFSIHSMVPNLHIDIFVLFLTGILSDIW